MMRIQFVFFKCIHQISEHSRIFFIYSPKIIICFKSHIFVDDYPRICVRGTNIFQDRQKYTSKPLDFLAFVAAPRHHFASTFSIYSSNRNSSVVFVDSFYEFHSLYTYDSQNIGWKFHHFNEQISECEICSTQAW